MVIAPDADEDAIALFAAKKNLRLLLTGGLPDPRAPGLTVALGRRRLAVPVAATTPSSTTCRSRSSPSARRRAQELADLLFAFRIAKHVKSNAIVYAKDGATVGIGAGQMSRVDSSRIAAWKAAEAAKAAGAGRKLGEGLGRRLGRLLPLRRRPARGGRSGRDGGDPARRLDARRRGDRGRRRGRPGDGDDRPPPLPPLEHYSRKVVTTFRPKICVKTNEITERVRLCDLRTRSKARQKGGLRSGAALRFFAVFAQIEALFGKPGEFDLRAGRRNAG